MSQLSLLQSALAPRMEGINLWNCPVEELLPLTADLAIADPPWLNRSKHGESGAHDHYDGLPVEQIIEHLEQIDAPRLVVWITYPVWTADWPAALPGWGRPVTAGTWLKSDPDDSGHYGQGLHWAGCAEGVLVYTRPNAYNNKKALRNAWHEPAGLHSRKPVGWQAQMIRRWCPPGGTVFDPYAGLCSVPEAILELGKRYKYVGAEISAERYAQGSSLLAQWTPHLGGLL